MNDNKIELNRRSPHTIYTIVNLIQFNLINLTKLIYLLDKKLVLIVFISYSIKTYGRKTKFNFAK